MIDKLSLRWFKSWQDSGALRLGPLTGLFGTNSSGKTSLLQLLLLLKQTADSTDRKLILDLGDKRSAVELGTFQDLAYRHDLSQPLAWTLRWKLPAPLEIVDPQRPERMLFSDAKMGFSAELKWRKNGSAAGRLAVERLAYAFAGAEFGMQPVADKPDDYELLNTHSKFKFKRVTGRPWNLPEPAKCYGFPDQTRAYFQNARSSPTSSSSSRSCVGASTTWARCATTPSASTHGAAASRPTWADAASGSSKRCSPRAKQASATRSARA